MAWLRDHEQREKQALLKAAQSVTSQSDDNISDWITAQAADLQNQIISRKLKDISDKILKRDQHINEIRKRVSDKVHVFLQYVYLKPFIVSIQFFSIIP